MKHRALVIRAGEREEMKVVFPQTREKRTRSYNKGRSRRNSD